MKLHLALILFASSGVVTSATNLFSNDEVAGVTDNEGATSFCTSRGQTLASMEEWCSYARANPGVQYGNTSFRDSVDVEDSCNTFDVEGSCDIPRLTAAPTPAPTYGEPIRTHGREPPRRKLGLLGCGELNNILCVPKNPASGSGDPHFKTWTGDKFDYHGECDLVLVDNPTFADGLGLKLHIRTTRVKYYSFIETVALQIGDDVLEFNNDVENFMINGAPVAAMRKYHTTMLGGYVVRRDPGAISVRLDQDAKAKIDFHTRKIGFPAVIVDGGSTDIFAGSLGLLGEWTTGNKLARDGETELNDDDATAFALEWQVRDTEPMLFKEARFPQFPSACTPPKKMMKVRLGMSEAKREAEKACAHWGADKEECVFDVIATRDVMIAVDGFIIDSE